MFGVACIFCLVKNTALILSLDELKLNFRRQDLSWHAKQRRECGVEFRCLPRTHPRRATQE